jgi:hypothetical protein
MGPFYKSYGLFIIKQYPSHFMRYFVWPNFKKYYAPPVEFLETYNSGKQYVTKETKKWFGYKTTMVSTRLRDNNVWILNFYPILSGIINVIMLCSLACYGLLKGWKHNKYFNKTIVLGGIIWLSNAGFTIFASSVALRFQAFPIILTTINVALLIDWMIGLMSDLQRETLIKNEHKVLKGGIVSKSIA